MKTIDTLVPKELIPDDPDVDEIDVRKNTRRSILADSKKDAAEYVKSYDVGRGAE